MRILTATLSILIFSSSLDGPVENVRRVGVEPEDDPPVHHDAAIVETRDVVLEAIDPVEALVRLGKGIGGHGLDPHEDADAARFCSQQEQFIVFREEHVGLENVRIFYACESGSRAWGFPSTESDYSTGFASFITSAAAGATGFTRPAGGGSVNVLFIRWHPSAEARLILDRTGPTGYFTGE